jgi:hypothetical protein
MSFGSQKVTLRYHHLPKDKKNVWYQFGFFIQAVSHCPYTYQLIVLFILAYFRRQIRNSAAAKHDHFPTERLIIIPNSRRWRLNICLAYLLRHSH